MWFKITSHTCSILGGTFERKKIDIFFLSVNVNKHFERLQKPTCTSLVLVVPIPNFIGTTTTWVLCENHGIPLSLQLIGQVMLRSMLKGTIVHIKVIPILYWEICNTLMIVGVCKKVHFM